MLQGYLSDCEHDDPTHRHDLDDVQVLWLHALAGFGVCTWSTGAPAGCGPAPGQVTVSGSYEHMVVMWWSCGGHVVVMGVLPNMAESGRLPAAVCNLGVLCG